MFLSRFAIFGYCYYTLRMCVTVLQPKCTFVQDHPLSVCVCVCIWVGWVWGLVAKWCTSLSHDPWVMSSSPTTRRWILSNLLPLPPTTPTSPPSCEWVPGISWGANHSSFSLNSSGPGGTLGTHTTCCDKVAGPPASS